MEMQYIYRCRDAILSHSSLGTFTSGTKRIFKIMQLDLTHGLESIFIPVDRVLPSNLAIHNHVTQLSLVFNSNMIEENIALSDNSKGAPSSLEVETYLFFRIGFNNMISGGSKHRNEGTTVP